MIFDKHQPRLRLTLNGRGGISIGGYLSVDIVPEYPPPQPAHFNWHTDCSFTNMKLSTFCQWRADLGDI